MATMTMLLFRQKKTMKMMLITAQLVFQNTDIKGGLKGYRSSKCVGSTSKLVKKEEGSRSRSPFEGTLCTKCCKRFQF